MWAFARGLGSRRVLHLVRPFVPTQVTTGTDVERRGADPMGHARILSRIIVSQRFHSGSIDMSPFPRPMVSLGVATPPPPSPGPAPSPGPVPSPGATYSRSTTTDASPLPPCAVAGTPRRRGTTLSISSSATSAAGVLLCLRRLGHCIGWCDDPTSFLLRTHRAAKRRVAKLTVVARTHRAAGPRGAVAAL